MKCKRKEIGSTRLRVNLVILSVLFLTGFFFMKLSHDITPKIVNIASLHVSKMMDLAFNDFVVQKYIDELDTQDILKIEKNKYDEILAVTYDMEKVYSLMKKMTTYFKEQINALEKGEYKSEYFDSSLSKKGNGFLIALPVGLASDSIYLTNLGPRIPVKVKFIGNMLTDVKTKVTNYGINNALLEVYINISLTTSLTSISANDVKTTDYDFLIAATVVEGVVPNLYGGTFQSQSSTIVEAIS